MEEPLFRKELRHETKRSVAIDGFVHRKTRYGAWKERYLRTGGAQLYYYTAGLNEIKAARFDGRTKLGPYTYNSVNKPWSEVFDLRAKGTKIKQTKEVFVATVGSRRLELRAESEAEARRWVLTLERLREYYQLHKKRLGTLKIDVDGAYVVGGSSTAVACAARLEEHDVHAASGSVDVCEVHAMFENFDERLEPVSFAAVKLRADIDVYQAGTRFRVSLVESSSRRSSFFGGDETTEIEFASRSMSLFELQEDAALPDAADEVETGGSAVDVDPEVAASWPRRAPDGTLPSKGYRWLALFDETRGQLDEDDDETPLRVRGFAHARIEYSENLVQAIDLIESEERYEAADDLDLTEFKTELVSTGMRRLSAVYDEFSAAGQTLQDLLEWRRPVCSLVAWLALAATVLHFPDSASLAVLPLVVIVGIVCAVPRAARLRQEAVEGRTAFCQAATEKVKRGIAEINLSVMEARGLVGADRSLLDSTWTYSDPYAVVIHEPPKTKRSQQMVVGVTSVKHNTRDPKWTSDVQQQSDRRAPLESDDLVPSMTDRGDEALKLVVGAAFGDQILNDVLEESGGRNAATLSAAAMRCFGDGACVKPPVDFRSRWKLAHGVLSPPTASWTWPALQEVADDQRPKPWRDSTGHIVVELWDHDVAQHDEFLGRCRIPLSSLFESHRVDTLDAWFTLEPYAADLGDLDDKKNAAIKKADATTLGKIRIAARTRLVTDRAPSCHAWQHDQSVRRRLLEPEFVVESDKKAGYVGQYKDVTRSLKSMQDSILYMATVMERLVALCTWVHPTKTLAVLGGFVAVFIVCLLVPNNILVASFITKLFMNGLVLKFRGHDDSEVPPVDPTETQVFNLVHSLPNATQRSDAYKYKRLVFAAQAKRVEATVRISLHFAFRVRSQLHACIVSRSGVPVQPSHDAASSDSKRWTHVYVVVVDAMVLIWPSVAAAADNKKPLVSLIIAGPPLSAADAEKPPASWPPHPPALHLVSFAARTSKSAKIKDFFLALPKPSVATFTSAVEDEIVNAANLVLEAKTTIRHQNSLSLLTFQPWGRPRVSDHHAFS